MSGVPDDLPSRRNSSAFAESFVENSRRGTSARLARSLVSSKGPVVERSLVLHDRSDRPRDPPLGHSARICGHTSSTVTGADLVTEGGANVKVTQAVNAAAASECW